MQAWDRAPIAGTHCSLCTAHTRRTVPTIVPILIPRAVAPKCPVPALLQRHRYGMHAAADRCLLPAEHPAHRELQNPAAVYSTRDRPSPVTGEGPGIGVTAARRPAPRPAAIQ